jgi:hypothetical protein
MFECAICYALSVLLMVTLMSLLGIVGYANEPTRHRL